MRTALPLEDRFQRNIRRLLRDGRPPLIVAFSGGLDSTVLLHLLRFTWPGSGLTAAHFDHRMRDGSAEDASWAAGQAAAWGVAFRVGVAERELRSEAEARAARYAFLDGVDADPEALVVTAHHADDQAETVLFRVLRGTGIHGLAGIPASGRRRLRPLLPFWRSELEEYAIRHALEWRTDPSNATEGPVRNRLRLRILPEIERTISPRARRNLVALAKLARETEGALAGTVRDALAECVRRDGEAMLLSRARLAQYDPAVRSRVVRKVLSAHGIVLSRAGTRTAIEFITGAHSGRELPLPGGGRIRIEFGEARIEGSVRDSPEADEPLAIPEVEAGEEFSGRLRLGGRRFRVTVRPASDRRPENGGGAIWSERLPTPGLLYPLHLRSRRPGDSVQTAAGRKPVKKLMIERKVPRSERASRPVLTDAEGRILWIAGVPFLPATTGGSALEISIHDD